jgi:hypothetical protein
MGADPMNARRTFTAAAFVLVSAATAACGGGAGPTLADNTTPDGPVVPFVPPNDTTVFVPESPMP